MISHTCQLIFAFVPNHAYINRNERADNLASPNDAEDGQTVGWQICIKYAEWKTATNYEMTSLSSINELEVKLET